MTRQQRMRLAPCLAALLRQHTVHSIENDPISFPRRYRDPKEIEVVGWLAASFAYGSVPLFSAIVEKVLSLAGESFYHYLCSFDLKRERRRFNGIYYRFDRQEDILSWIDLMSKIVQKYGAIKPLFLSCYHEEDHDLGETLARFVDRVKALDSRSVHQEKKPNGLLGFLSTPEKGSACKRLNLYLRWMVRRKDGIDFGLWKEIPPSKLIIPLDTHIARIGRYLGLTFRKTADFKMAREITETLKYFDPIDPLKYDFSLCHLGISDACPKQPMPEKCRLCPLQPACKMGRSFLLCFRQ